MKRFTSMLVLVFVMTASAFAQSRQISGTVKSADDNAPVAGATVIVAGTSTGAVTDGNGNYIIKNVNGAVTIEVNFFGFQPASATVAATASTQDFVLAADAIDVDEVVVTGMGLTRAKKALGYAVEEVDGEELNKVRTGNVVSSMSGRVAGVQIRNSSGQLGGGAKINIRGNTSITGNNQPLFVVDGVPISNEDYSSGDGASSGYNTGNLAGDIASDDIESMSVLKGASATAIYGSRGANGVVLITTKKGKQGSKSFGVSVNSSVAIENASILPKYQKRYGGGSGFAFQTISVDGKTYNYPDMATDESWGPKYDANTKYLTWNSFDEWDTANYMVEKPWLYPENDYSTYYETGVAYTNNVTISGSDEKYSYRLSYTNLNQTGITPNSHQKRNTISFSGTSKMNDYIDSWITANYVNSQTHGRQMNGYDGGAMYQWIHTELDYSDLKDYKNPDGTQRTWNRQAWNNAAPNFANNPYWIANEDYQSDSRNRFYGNTGININVIDGLKITGRVGVDTFTDTQEERTAMGGAGTSGYTLISRTSTEVNMDLFASYNKRFADDKFGLSAMVGTNSNDRHYSYTGGYTNSGLIIPGLYNLSNSVVTASSYDHKQWSRINAIYANATFDYNQLIYLDLTARNDWSSTLPSGNRSYFYPSANLSLIISELGSLKDVSWLDFAKARFGIAQVGNDTNPYQLMNTYSINTPFGPDAMFNTSTTLKNANLLPEKTNSWEIGLEAEFLNRRLGFDASYYDKRTTNQIIPASVSGATGYYYQYINAGELANHGFEFTVHGTPIQSASGFRWDLSANISTLSTEVVSIMDGVDKINLASNGFSVYTSAIVGESYPMIYGTNYVYGENGEKLVDTKGRYLQTTPEAIAKVTPDFTAGLSSSFSYKGIDLNILFDMQMGGHQYYMSQRYGMYSGILAESAMDTNVPGATGDIRESGYIIDGAYGSVDGSYANADGSASASAVENTSVISGLTYSKWYDGGANAMSVYKTDFIKLREVSLGYTIPQRLTGPIKDIRLSAYGRNLATFMTDQDNFDPEYVQSAGSNAQGLEGGYIPTTRSFGFSVGFNF